MIALLSALRAAHARIRWISMSAGFAYNLIGPGPQAMTMPPAPLLTSDGVIAGMAGPAIWDESEALQEFFPGSPTLNRRYVLMPRHDADVVALLRRRYFVESSQV